MRGNRKNRLPSFLLYFEKSRFLINVEEEKSSLAVPCHYYIPSRSLITHSYYTIQIEGTSRGQCLQRTLVTGVTLHVFNIVDSIIYHLKHLFLENGSNKVERFGQLVNKIVGIAVRPVVEIVNKGSRLPLFLDSNLLRFIPVKRTIDKGGSYFWPENCSIDWWGLLPVLGMLMLDLVQLL